LAKVKTHFVFPDELLRDIDRIAGERKRSAFVVEAAREKLEREKLRKTLKKAIGLWKKEEYPEFETPKDISRWVSELRERDFKRRIKVG